MKTARNEEGYRRGEKSGKVEKWKKWKSGRSGKVERSG
jgi:hypothetical protein